MFNKFKNMIELLESIYVYHCRYFLNTNNCIVIDEMSQIKFFIISNDMHFEIIFLSDAVKFAKKVTER